MTRTITTLLALVALVGFAVAAQPSVRPQTDPPEYVEHQGWELVEGEWSEMPIGDITNCARVWCLEEQSQDTTSCEVEHTVTFRQEASIAQWSEVEMTCDGFHWGVRVPGTYAAGPIAMNVRANYDVELSFDGFENLQPVDSEMTMDSMIPVMYAVTDEVGMPPPGDEDWMTPMELNALTFDINNGEQLHHEGFNTQFFAELSTTAGNGPTDWVDPDWAVITASLDEQQEWIDEDTGWFDDMPDFPLQ